MPAADLKPANRWTSSFWNIDLATIASYLIKAGFERIHEHSVIADD